MSVLPKNHREWLNCGCLGLVLRRYERRGMSAKCVTGDRRLDCRGAENLQDRS